MGRKWKIAYMSLNFQNSKYLIYTFSICLYIPLQMSHCWFFRLLSEVGRKWHIWILTDFLIGLSSLSLQYTAHHGYWIVCGLRCVHTVQSTCILTTWKMTFKIHISWYIIFKNSNISLLIKCDDNKHNCLIRPSKNTSN